uniref:Ig-like domain-containing protein n=1 Tax=Nomascus leucogenys TaxID=61853 RepID=A0A2I3G1Q8_NOMLE
MVGKMWPVLWTLCAVRVTVDAISVETSQDVLRASRGKSVTLPCTYHTSTSDRDGLIQWDKLLVTHTERVFIWQFSNKNYIYGELYKNRVSISSNVEQSDASITIDQLTMADNGTYECSVSLMSDLDGTTKSRVRLLVLASGQPVSLKNISTDTSGYYICTSSNEEGTQFCNITVAVRSPSMNVALYAGIAVGVVAALIITGIIIYCCCCRGKDDNTKDKEDARPNRAAYEEPPEQLRELSREREEEE